MAVNKVVFGGETVIDLTKDTVSPETLAEGVTAHDKSGNAIVGTMQAGGGGALEAVTGNIGVEMPGMEGIVYYTDGNGEFASLYGAGTIEVMKDSVLAVRTGSGMILSDGGLTQLGYPGGTTAFHVTGDFSLRS